MATPPISGSGEFGGGGFSRAGQPRGAIEATPDRVRLPSGVVVSGETDEQRRQRILQEEFQRQGDILERFGIDRSVALLPEDIQDRFIEDRFFPEDEKPEEFQPTSFDEAVDFFRVKEEISTDEAIRRAKATKGTGGSGVSAGRRTNMAENTYSRLRASMERDEAVARTNEIHGRGSISVRDAVSIDSALNPTAALDPTTKATRRELESFAEGVGLKADTPGRQRALDMLAQNASRQQVADAVAEEMRLQGAPEELIPQLLSVDLLPYLSAFPEDRFGRLAGAVERGSTLEDILE